MYFLLLLYCLFTYIHHLQVLSILDEFVVFDRAANFGSSLGFSNGFARKKKYIFYIHSIQLFAEARKLSKQYEMSVSCTV